MFSADNHDITLLIYLFFIIFNFFLHFQVFWRHQHQNRTLANQNKTTLKFSEASASYYFNRWSNIKIKWRVEK